MTAPPRVWPAANRRGLRQAVGARMADRAARARCGDAGGDGRGARRPDATDLHDAHLRRAAGMTRAQLVWPMIASASAATPRTSVTAPTTAAASPSAMLSTASSG